MNLKLLMSALWVMFVTSSIVYILLLSWKTHHLMDSPCDSFPCWYQENEKETDDFLSFSKESMQPHFIRAESINFTIQPNKRCQVSANVRMAVLIHSSAADWRSRMAIRRTWGHAALGRGIFITFVLGQGSNASVMQKIKEEAQAYNDILAIDVKELESSINVIKTTALLRWVQDHCKALRILVKTDHDTFINVSLLLKFVKDVLLAKKARLSIYGHLAHRVSPVRDLHSEGYVSNHIFPDADFPDFVRGPMYLMTADCVAPLLRAIQQTPVIDMEDVFITGLCAKRAGIRRSHLPAVQYLKGYRQPCSYRHYIVFHYVPPKEMFSVWSAMNDGTLESCSGLPDSLFYLEPNWL